MFFLRRKLTFYGRLYYFFTYEIAVFTYALRVYMYTRSRRCLLKPGIESTTLSLTMRFALIKWPEELPGLLYGIIPVDIFENQREIYRDPYTGHIPNEDPKWGSYQYIKTVWSKTPLYCLLIAEGSLENMKQCLNIICSRYFKKNIQTGVAIGQTMFDETSPLRIIT